MADSFHTLPHCEFDDSLPINQHHEPITAALRAHQVVVVCGETGSGKTTQLPKLCWQLGLGEQPVCSVGSSLNEG